MKRINSVFLVLAFLLGACTTPNPTSDTIQATESSPADSSSDSGSTTSAREAVLSEIENTVSFRKTSADELATAQQGASILEGGSVETGADGRVRVDLMPEGTIVRVGPNSAFSFPKLTEENGEPKTTIELLFGKVFVLLNGGSLSVETPSGVASVRGSLLSVEYNPETKRISAACMEGDCTLQGEEGEEIEIPEGEESFVEDDELPMDPYPMDQDEVMDWLDENPDLELFMPELPDPEDYPDLPDDFDGDMEDIPTEEEGEPATEEPTGNEEPATEEPSEGEEPPVEEPSEEEPSDDGPSDEEPSDDGPPDEGEGE
jgi:hypothetical protein